MATCVVDVALVYVTGVCKAQGGAVALPAQWYVKSEVMSPRGAAEGVCERHNSVGMPKTEYFHDIDPEIRTYYEKLWEEILLAEENV